MTNDELSSIFEASTGVCWPRNGDYSSLSGSQITSFVVALDRARQAPAPSEPEAQKAVAQISCLTNSLRHVEWLTKMPPVGTLLYTSPSCAASMEVQGLTDEELDKAVGIIPGRNVSLEMALRAVARAAISVLAAKNGWRLVEGRG